VSDDFSPNARESIQEQAITARTLRHHIVRHFGVACIHRKQCKTRQPTGASTIAQIDVIGHFKGSLERDIHCQHDEIVAVAFIRPKEVSIAVLTLIPLLRGVVQNLIKFVIEMKR
jgi:hypothetical protein